VYCAIETSFDEAGLAVCSAAGEMVFSVLSSQVELHAPYGGCVPELAARTHLSDLPQLWRRMPQELQTELRYMGVTAGPGLPGCLLAGVNFARGAATALRLPLYGLNHLSGHIFSPFIPPRAGDSGQAAPTLEFPHLALLISGGHTELYLIGSLVGVTLLGQTLDDAAGELLDKVSAMLGHGYPGGARLEELARTYPGITPDASYEGRFRLPVPMRGSGDLNFSYSGLKTAVVRIARAGGDGSQLTLAQEEHPSLLAALFAAVAESLWIKVAAALGQHPVELITVSGGVAVNGFIRERFQAEAQRRSLRLAFPAPGHCLDNAEMMAWLLKLYVDAGIPPAPFDADGNWNPGQPK
jgi:N6-L-threonylcarbamoyladenine synthase